MHKLFLHFAHSCGSSRVANRTARLGFGFPPLLFLLIQGFTVPSFLPQPVINGYRNKSTFSVNRGPDGNPKTVGLYVGTGKGQWRTRSWVENYWCGLRQGFAVTAPIRVRSLNPGNANRNTTKSKETTENLSSLAS